MQSIFSISEYQNYKSVDNVRKVGQIGADFNLSIAVVRKKIPKRDHKLGKGSGTSVGSNACCSTHSICESPQ